MGAASSPVGLILTGGGARAAYQVGELAGVVDVLDPSRSRSFRNPFSIICGSSAGAINAAALACRADTPHIAVDRIQYLWENLHTNMVYRADAADLLSTGLRWLGMLSFGWLMPEIQKTRPASLDRQKGVTGMEVS